MSPCSVKFYFFDFERFTPSFIILQSEQLSFGRAYKAFVDIVHEHPAQKSPLYTSAEHASFIR
jgi:hypothetical protein